jgi:integrase
MSLALSDTEFQERLNHPNNPAHQYLSEECLKKDIWIISETLPHLAQEAHVAGVKKLYFEKISLRWLNELTKLTILVATGNRYWKLSKVFALLISLKKFNRWLIEKDYLMESELSQQMIQQYLAFSQNNHAYANTKNFLNWLRFLYQINWLSFDVEKKNREKLVSPKSPPIIPEKIKHQLDRHLKTLEPTIFLVFKLLEGLGLRSKELGYIPLNCLRKHQGIYQIRIATAKQNYQERERDIPDELVSLVQQQQQKVKNEFGQDFSWLIPNWQKNRDYLGQGPRGYNFFPEQIQRGSQKLNRILKNIIEENNICDENGQLAHVTTHDFRRTYATVAERMGKSPDQIQHGLRHLNLDMQDSYVYVPPQEQEKRIKRTLVNKEGEITTYKTDKDAETLRVERKIRQVETGICTRPNIMEECEYEYVCLGCEYVRFSEEHLTKLLVFRQHNLELLNSCIEQGQSDSRRANSVRQLLDILEKIITSLEINTKPEKKND